MCLEGALHVISRLFYNYQVHCIIPGIENYFRGSLYCTKFFGSKPLKDSVSVCRWINSGFGCLELNTDAAYGHHLGVAGLGFIIRNHDVCVMAAGFNRACLINSHHDQSSCCRIWYSGGSTSRALSLLHSDRWFIGFDILVLYLKVMCLVTVL
ncbi:hypothetical protein TorRG33x02_133140 [Trema orientale]|uniref:Uncharacterized protein n=1 Tax=Trema orientale TaxID=63057 RepID=A0A2P5EZF9_TREOI|nr:hypothetical protein TorRG33x02_133140 [Trema orientale]